MRINEKIVNQATGSTLVTGPGRVLGVMATAESSTPQTVTLWDNTAASGTLLWRLYVSSYAPVIVFFPPGFHLSFTIGLHVVTSAYPTCIVYYGE